MKFSKHQGLHMRPYVFVKCYAYNLNLRGKSQNCLGIVWELVAFESKTCLYIWPANTNLVLNLLVVCVANNIIGPRGHYNMARIFA